MWNSIFNYCLFCVSDVPIYQDLYVKPNPLVTANVGDNITLTCEANIGVFKEFPSWFKGGQTLRSRSVRKDKEISELRITNASLDDAGLYICSAVKLSDGFNMTKSIDLVLQGEWNVTLEFLSSKYATLRYDTLEIKFESFRGVHSLTLLSCFIVTPIFSPPPSLFLAFGSLFHLPFYIIKFI